MTTSQADIVFQGEESGDVAGFTVGAAGDLDGDGISDFMIGAPMPEDPIENSGAACIILGSEDLVERLVGE